MEIFDKNSDQQNHTLKQQGLFPTYFLLIFRQKITERQEVVLTLFYHCLRSAFWMVEHTPKTTVVVAMRSWSIFHARLVSANTDRREVEKFIFAVFCLRCLAVNSIRASDIVAF